MKRSLHISIFLILVLLLGGCKSRKGSNKETYLPKMEKAELIAEIQQRELQYETFSARIQADIELGKTKLSSKVQLKLQKDQCIQFSIQPMLGIEAARIEITPDSIRMLDRINKVYAKSGIEYLRTVFAVPFEFDFYNLQSLLTNTLFYPGKTQITKRELEQMRFVQDERKALLRMDDNSGARYQFSVDRSGYLTSARISDEQEKSSLFWRYDKFEALSVTTFPYQMQATITQREAQKGEFRFNFAKIEIDKEQSMQFSIPKSYKEISFILLIKSLSVQ